MHETFLKSWRSIVSVYEGVTCVAVSFSSYLHLEPSVVYTDS